MEKNNCDIEQKNFDKNKKDELKARKLANCLIEKTPISQNNISLKTRNEIQTLNTEVCEKQDAPVYEKWIDKSLGDSINISSKSSLDTKIPLKSKIENKAIPQSKPEEKAEKIEKIEKNYYNVKKGDTLWSIVKSEFDLNTNNEILNKIKEIINYQEDKVFKNRLVKNNGNYIIPGDKLILKK